MRALPILLMLALPVPAAWAAAPAVPAAPAAPPSADAAKIESLQQRLLASQQTIATLERELDTAKNRAVVMDECRVKNGRLVFISRELIEAYERRYKMGHKDPLQLGRRRFEFELQALSDAVYTSRIDVPVPRVPGDKPVAEPADAPAKPGKKAAKAKADTSAPAQPAHPEPVQPEPVPPAPATTATPPPAPAQAH